MGMHQIMSKVRVVHATLIRTAKRGHPRSGHKLDPDHWRRAWRDPTFQDRCERYRERPQRAWDGEVKARRGSQDNWQIRPRCLAE